MSKIYKIFGNFLGNLVFVGGVKSASAWIFYQPRVPKITK